MATKKQRKRSQKERRHEYETVWVDAEGNELEEPPEDASERQPRERKAPPKRPERRDSRATRVPLEPSWRRAAKRALILGVAIFAFVALTSRSKNGQHAYASAAFLAVVSTALFIPYMYGIDRFIRRRWERKQAESAKKR